MKLDTKLGSLAQEGGFTLIEMLIVVAIIAILVAIAVPALNTAKIDAQAAKRASIGAAVETAKARAVLKDEAVQGADATGSYSVFSKYVLVNGVAPAVATIANSASNGAGSDITAWGSFPASDGSTTGSVAFGGGAVTD